MEPRPRSTSPTRQRTPLQLPPSRPSSLILSSPSPTSAKHQESPSAILAKELTTMFSKDENMDQIIKVQQDTLERLRTTNDALDTFNEFSAARYLVEAKSVEGYTKLLREIKTDLDSIFRRVRVLKATVSARHPKEFARAGGTLIDAGDDDD
ncbi:hypothetical protein SmJEL517_g04203 [Synchytrium microbalum]|uniref:KxDL domain-containing protein n=1 Tax=Synchytrium microbalum TaxID=1806994 RepID=A0A507BUU3_9FUNG|nr:uncharacterized protein SmJEL517_g04203 [Synchytrium microbalum]TPX32697.1 hypothetical protein SmJEL517_g04203 [Synchytrium microbalum]